MTIVSKLVFISIASSILMSTPCFAQDSSKKIKPKKQAIQTVHRSYDVQPELVKTIPKRIVPKKTKTYGPVIRVTGPIYIAELTQYQVGVKLYSYKDVDSMRALAGYPRTQRYRGMSIVATF